jgi:type II secretory pathway pseudopilin PulG
VVRQTGRARGQRGFGLIALLAVIVLAFAYVITSRLNAASRFIAVDRNQNALVMARAKQALIGYVAQQASLAGEMNPGRLPCPEPSGYYNTSNEGIAAGNCTLPAVGRLPWRTLGLDKLVDTAGEPLWYVVSPGWALSNSTTPPLQTVINSDSRGQLTVDGSANDSVALIVAPGARLATAACGGAPAKEQQRPVTGPPDVLDYLECENAAGTSFVTVRPGQVFNDQVLRVTVSDLMPSLEAAIADRMQREIAPALKGAAYTSAQYAGIPAGDFLYPYPVPFANPGTSSYLGGGPYVNDHPQGLLPFNQINSTCSSPPPCTSLPVTGTVSLKTGGLSYGGSLASTPSCSASATEFVCTGKYQRDADPSKDVRIEVIVTFSNVAMGLRTRSTSPMSLTVVKARDDNASPPPWITVTPTLQEFRMNDGATTLPDLTTPPRGSASIRFRAVLPNIVDNGWNTTADYDIRIQRSVIGDHFLLNADPNVGTNPLGAATSWFVRNRWYRVTYYAVAEANTADYSDMTAVSPYPLFGCNRTNCLRFNEGLGCAASPGSDYCNIRALLVLGGASITNPAGRPNGNRSDYVEYTNGDDGTFYEQHIIRRPTNIAMTNGPWNDRVILVDWLPSYPPLLTTPNNHPQVVSVSPLRINYLP